MAYGFTTTAAGRSLLLQLQAGNSMTISRIAVGDGEVPDGVNPATLTNLIHEVARSQATCTVPIVKDDTLSFDIEYRNKWDDDTFGDGYADLDGLTESFWIKEYAVFALDASGKEIMLYYASLGEFPEPVAKWNGRNLVSKRYPVEISIVADNTPVETAFPSRAFVTSEYLEERLAGFAKSFITSEYLEERLADLATAQPGNGAGVVFSPTRPGGDWKLWLQDLGEVDESIQQEAVVEVLTAPLDSPGEFAVVDESGEGETVLNMTDDPQSAGENDIIVQEQ